MSGLALAVTLVAAGQWVDLTWDTVLKNTRESAEYGRLLDRALDKAVAHTTKSLQVRLSRAVKAHVYTRVNYAVRFGEGRAVRHAAHYRAGMIHINGGSVINKAFVALVTHEMVHALLDHRGRGDHFPIWFNEGLAERAEHQVLGPHTLTPNQQLRSALEKQQLPSLPQRRGLSPAQYMTSWAAVVYLVDEYGEKQLLELVRRVIEGEDFERVFSAVTRQSSRLFEKRFRASLGARPRSRSSTRLKFK